MFEKQIDKVRVNILSSIELNKQYLYLVELISNPDIDKAYTTYFNAEAEWWLYEEQMKRQSNQNFNLMDSEIQTVLIQLDKLLKKYARFDRTGLETLVNFAVKTRLNMVCRPRTTLKWFVYRGEQVKPFYEIFKRLDYLFDYKYIIDGFMQWAEDNDIRRQSKELISSIEFTNIIEKIDNEYIYNLSPDAFVDIIEPMFEFFNEDKRNLSVSEFGDKDSVDNRTIPIEALIIFLDDKGIFPIARSMEKLLREDNIETVSKSDFSDYIHTMLGEIEKNSVMKPVSDVEVNSEAITYLDYSESSNIKESGLGIGLADAGTDEEHREDVIYIEDMPILSVIVDEQKNIQEMEKQQSEENYGLKIIEIENKDDISVSEEKLLTDETDSSSINLSEKPVSLIPLKSLIIKKLEDKFINKLFNKDMAKYYLLVNDLEECYSWRDAAKKIDTCYSEKSIDPNSSLAVEFRNTIQRRYEI